MWFDALFLFAVLTVTLIVVIVPVPQYWANNKDNNKEKLEISPTNSSTVKTVFNLTQLVKKHIKYVHAPEKKNPPIFGLIDLDCWDMSTKKSRSIYPTNKKCRRRVL